MIRLGLDTYSVRAWKWKAIELLDYAASLKLDAIQISSLSEYESLEPAHLEKVKAHADRLGIQIDGGTGCICPTTKSWSASQGDPVEYLKTALRVGHAVGSPSVRCFVGTPLDRAMVPETPIEMHLESTLWVLRAARSLAMDLNVKIAVENHGDFSARELRTLITAAGTEYVGACIDTGNPVSICEDPLLSLEVLAPFALTTHIRDSVVFEHARGAAWQWVALGDGSIDWTTFTARFRELCPNVAMQLEIITGRAPQIHSYFESGFWKNYPNLPAADFARFARLAKNGHPFMGNMVIGDVRGMPPPPELAEPLKLQQRRDLERSAGYARRVLGLGRA
jgi:sugar phosphate isomerase/epimerase